MPYPRAIVPFNEFLPDQGLLGNPGLIVADNCSPLGDHGFVPNPLLNLASAVVPGESFIGAMHVAPFGGVTGTEDYQVFVGADNNRLYRVVPTAFEGGTWSVEDYTRSSGGVYTVDSWRWTSFGEGVIAVPGLDDDPQILLPATVNFQKLVSGGSPNDPRGKFVSPLGNRVVLAHIKEGGTEYPNRVWWSATNDARTYGDPSSSPTTRTDYEDLEDDWGSIQGLVAGTDYAHVLKRRASYRMNFGGPFQFSFVPTGVGHGTVHPDSVAALGGRVYFWGPAGPTVITESLEAIPLGPGKFSRSLQDENWFLDTPIALNRASLTRVYVATDPVNDLVVWAYNPAGASASAGSVLFVYNARHDRASIHRTWLPTGQTPAVSPHALALRPEQPAWPWSPMRNLLVAVVENAASPALKIGFFDPLREAQATLRNGYSELSPGRTVRVVGVRPLFTFNSGSSGPDDFSVTIRGINKPWEPSPTTVTRKVADGVDTNGFIQFPSSQFSRFHSFECLTGGGPETKTLVTDDGTALVDDAGVSIAAFFGNVLRMAEIEGIEIEFEEGPVFVG